MLVKNCPFPRPLHFLFACLINTSHWLSLLTRFIRRKQSIYHFMGETNHNMWTLGGQLGSLTMLVTCSIHKFFLVQKLHTIFLWGHG
jgi:hypothetical protein